MKKHLLIILTLSLLPLGIACDSSAPEDELIGDWLSQSLRISGCDNPDDNANFETMSISACTETSGEGCIHQTFSFTANNYTSTSNAVNDGNLVSLDADGTYTLEGNSAEFCETGLDHCRSGNMTVTGNSLTISNLGNQGSNCITGVTASRVQRAL